MPSIKNWVNFLYINTAFVIYIAAVFYYSQVSEIKANWPLYRCNPMYMFLADDIEENLAYCSKSTQSNIIRDFLYYIMGYLINIMRSFMGDSQDINSIFNKIRNLF